MTPSNPNASDVREIICRLREAQQLVALIGLGDMNAAVDLRNRALKAAIDMLESLSTRHSTGEAVRDAALEEAAQWHFSQANALDKNANVSTANHESYAVRYRAEADQHRKYANGIRALKSSPPAHADEISEDEVEAGYNEHLSWGGQPPNLSRDGIRSILEAARTARGRK